MLIKALNDLDKRASYTFLSNTEASGASTVRVQNVDGFVASWGIQIGKTGEERSEVLTLGTATPSGTALTVTGTTRFEHATDTPIYAIKWNQIVFERSTVGTAGTATPMTSGTLTITADSPYTVFDDTTGATTYAYKTYYRNSVTTDISSESDWLTPAGYSFYSLAKMRERTKNKLFNAGYIKYDLLVDDWINEWTEKMTNTATDVNQDYNIGTADVAFGTSGLGTITASDFKEVRRMWVTTNGTDFYASTKIGMTGYSPNQTFNSTYPYHDFQGDNIFNIHPSGSLGTARIAYYKLNSVLVNDSDELPVSMRGYTKSFVDYALSMAYYMDEKDQKGLLFSSNAKEELERFRSEITPRSKSGPVTIRAFEPIDGDETFGLI